MEPDRLVEPAFLFHRPCQGRDNPPGLVIATCSALQNGNPFLAAAGYLAIAVRQQQIDLSDYAEIRRHQGTGSLQPIDRHEPLSLRHGHPSFEVTGAAAGNAARLKLLNPGGGSVRTVQFTLRDQAFSKCEDQAEIAGEGGDALAQDAPGTIGVVLFLLDGRSKLVKGRIGGLLQKARFDELPRLDPITGFQGDLGGDNQHVGVVGGKLHRLLDVAWVGRDLKLAAIPISQYMSEGRAGVGGHHRLDFTIGEAWPPPIPSQQPR